MLREANSSRRSANPFHHNRPAMREDKSAPFFEFLRCCFSRDPDPIHFFAASPWPGVSNSRQGVLVGGCFEQGGMLGGCQQHHFLFGTQHGRPTNNGPRIWIRNPDARRGSGACSRAQARPGHALPGRLRLPHELSRGGSHKRGRAGRASQARVPRRSLGTRERGDLTIFKTSMTPRVF